LIFELCAFSLRDASPTRRKTLSNREQNPKFKPQRSS
jgi:hypothetical protein